MDKSKQNKQVKAISQEDFDEFCKENADELLAARIKAETEQQLLRESLTTSPAKVLADQIDAKVLTLKGKSEKFVAGELKEIIRRSGVDEKAKPILYQTVEDYAKDLCAEYAKTGRWGTAEESPRLKKVYGKTSHPARRSKTKKRK